MKPTRQRWESWNYSLAIVLRGILPRDTVALVAAASVLAVSGLCISAWFGLRGCLLPKIGLTAILLACFVSHVFMTQVKEPATTEAPSQVQYPTEIHLKFHRSAADTEGILSSIDGLLNFSSEHSGLPIRSRVQGHLIDRDEVKQKGA
jgi:hypothetical protein